jgi:hypothetical protein
MAIAAVSQPEAVKKRVLACRLIDVKGLRIIAFAKTNNLGRFHPVAVERIKNLAREKILEIELV